MQLFRLLLCTGGIYSCYITYGYLQEGIFKYRDQNGNRFHSTLTLLLIQTLLNVAVAYVICIVKRLPSLPKAPFLLPGFTFIAAMLCSNEALRFVSYPTQVLAKSCKLVPVLLVNVFVYGRVATLFQVVHVILVTIGIVLFRLKNADSDQESNSAFGLALLVASLVLDGITGPTQQHLQQKYQPTPFHLMLYCNMWGSLLITIFMALLGENLSGILFLIDPSNTSCLVQVVLVSIAGAAGQAFIYYTLLEFGYA